MVEMSASSDWYNDEVELSAENENEVLMKNISKLERLEKNISEAKVSVAESAFKLISMNEQNSTEYERNVIISDINKMKEAVNKANEDIRASNSTKTRFSFNDHSTDSATNRNFSLLNAVAILKPQDLYGQKISFKDLIEKLNQELKIDLDQGSQNLILQTHQDLIKKQDDLVRKRSEL